METVLRCEVSPEDYTARAFILGCGDDRIHETYDEFKVWVERELGMRADLLKIFGFVKALAGGPSPARDFCLGQVEISIRLHGVDTVILTEHIDCRGYGGSASFDHKREEEERHHRAQLEKAQLFLESAIPEIGVKCYLVDFRGVHHFRELERQDVAVA